MTTEEEEEEEACTIVYGKNYVIYITKSIEFVIIII